MTNKEYNGWHNYETWLVNLWMDNDGSDAYWRECAERLVKDDPGAAIRSMADLIKEEHEQRWSEINNDKASVLSDLMNAAFSEVNWEEIASHYIDEVEVEEEAVA